MGWSRLDGVDNKMLYVPEGFAHGFLSLSDKTELLYKCSSYFNKEAERTLAGLITPSVFMAFGNSDF